MTTVAHETSLLAQARELAGAAAELGGSIAAVLLGGARAAGLDPAAYAPLTGAALALGAGQLTVYSATGTAYPDDRHFLADVCDAEDDARDLLYAATTLAGKVTAALAALEDDDSADPAAAARAGQSATPSAASAPSPRSSARSTSPSAH
jgi:hypothetical protein